MPASFWFPLFVPKMHLSSDLALDEGESLVAVDVNVLLVVVGVVSIAAVWVLRVAVALDDAAAGRCAGESSRAGGELKYLLIRIPRVGEIVDLRLGPCRYQRCREDRCGCVGHP